MLINEGVGSIIGSIVDRMKAKEGARNAIASLLSVLHCTHLCTFQTYDTLNYLLYKSQKTKNILYIKVKRLKSKDSTSTKRKTNVAFFGAGGGLLGDFNLGKAGGKKRIQNKETLLCL